MHQEVQSSSEKEKMDEKEKKPFKCNYCDKSFGLASYRSKHIKRIHQISSNGEHILQQTKVSCKLCHKQFVYKSSMQRHMNIIHFNKKNYSCDLCNYKSVAKEYLKSHIVKVHNGTKRSVAAKYFKCAHCESSFSTKSNLRRHEKKIHQIQRFARTKISRKCPLCPFTSSTLSKREINDHFKNRHGLKMEWEKKTFQNVTEFNVWKNTLEVESNSSFVKAKFSTKLSLHYVCHRSGKFKSRGTNRRHMKVIGSCKINAHCPCEIVAKTNKNGSVSVTYLPTHVGHKKDLKFLRLRPEDRNKLAAKLLSKLPHKTILQEIRMSVSNNELKRINLINRNDLWNIKNSYNINKKSEKHPYDPEDIFYEAEDTIAGEITLPQISNQGTDNGKEEKKKTIMDMCKRILEKANTEEQIEYVETKIKAIYHTVEAIATSADCPVQVEGE